MNGLRLPITWNTGLDERTISASVLMPGGDEIRGLTLIHSGDFHTPAHFDRTMLNLIKNLSDAGWASRIIDDNTIEVVRLATRADINYEQRRRAPPGTPISELM